MDLVFKIERKIKPSRVLFFATVNGKRLNNINYARKYDARGLICWFRANFTKEQIIEKLNK